MWDKLKDFFTDREQSQRPKIDFNHKKPQIVIRPKAPEQSTESATTTDISFESYDIDRRVFNSIRYHEIDFEGRKINFFRQENGVDCIACSCLNTAEALGLTGSENSGDHNVDSFRQWASRAPSVYISPKIALSGEQNDGVAHYKLVQDDGRDMAGAKRYEMLEMDDARKYFSDIYSIEPRAVTTENINQTLDSSKTNKMIIGITGAHCVAWFIGQNGHIYLFDSLFGENGQKPNGPKVRGIDDLKAFVDSTLRVRNEIRSYVIEKPLPKITILNRDGNS